MVDALFLYETDVVSQRLRLIRDPFNLVLTSQLNVYTSVIVPVILVVVAVVVDDTNSCQFNVDSKSGQEMLHISYHCRQLQQVSK